MGDVVTFPGRTADPAAARNLAGVAQARAALRRGRARAIDHEVDLPAADDPEVDLAGRRGPHRDADGHPAGRARAAGAPPSPARGDAEEVRS